MGRNYPRLKDGDSPEPWHFNLIYSALERWERLRGTGGIAVDLGDPPVIRGFPSETLVLVRTPSGGIPARDSGTGVWGTADVTLYDDSLTGSLNPKSSLGSRTETAYNPGPGAIPGSKDLFCHRDLSGRLIALVAYCA